MYSESVVSSELLLVELTSLLLLGVPLSLVKEKTRLTGGRLGEAFFMVPLGVNCDSAGSVGNSGPVGVVVMLLSFEGGRCLGEGAAGAGGNLKPGCPLPDCE